VLAVELCVSAGCASGGNANDKAFEDGIGDSSAEADSLEGAASEGGSSLDAGHEVDSSPDVPVLDEGGDAALDAVAVEASTIDGSGDGALLSVAPIGQWNFDEGTGTSSADLSGHGHPATLMGASSWAPAGKEGAGLALDGVSSYADVGVTLIDTTSSFTVAVWANLTVVGAWNIALSEDDVEGSLFGLKLRGDGSNQFDFDVELSDGTTPAFVVAQSTSTAQASTWVHLAGVRDASGGGTVKVYVNGALQANAALGQALLAASGHFVIGRGLYNGASGSYFHGTLDEVAVYDVALTSGQVATIYDAQR
jgi:alpha-N-arabinofuranosidase